MLLGILLNQIKNSVPLRVLVTVFVREMPCPYLFHFMIIQLSAVNTGRGGKDGKGHMLQSFRYMLLFITLFGGPL